MSESRRPARAVAPATARLSVIRMAMLAGVLVFGAVIWWLRRGGSAAEVDPATVANARVLAGVWLGVAVAGLAVLFALAGRQVDEVKRRTFSIIAWAVGEGAALAGGVVFMVAGDARWYLAGLFVFLVAFVLFPARRRD